MLLSLHLCLSPGFLEAKYLCLTKALNKKSGINFSFPCWTLQQIRFLDKQEARRMSSLGHVPSSLLCSHIVNRYYRPLSAAHNEAVQENIRFVFIY